MVFLSGYRRELAAAGERVQGAGSVVAGTARGPVECALAGTGPPVLSLHGVVGGVDHGLALADTYLGAGYRAVAVSRFGYLRSPVPEDPSAAAQADLYAALLDELGIERAAVLGTSAATASALRFAHRHPARCAALALCSIAVPPYPALPKPGLWANRAFFGSDFLFWAAMRYTPAVRRLMGVPQELEGRLAPEDEAYVRDLMGRFLPVSARVNGVMNDIRFSNPDLNDLGYLPEITVPTLVIHARDDPWGAFDGAGKLAGQIPGARFLGLESGGHLLLGHHQAVRAEIATFIREHARAPEAPADEEASMNHEQ